MTKERRDINFKRNIADELVKLRIHIKEKVSEAQSRGLDKLFADTCNSFNKPMLDFENIQKSSEELEKLKELKRLGKLKKLKEIKRLEELSRTDKDARMFQKMHESDQLFYPSINGGISMSIGSNLDSIETHGVNFKIGDNDYSIKMRQVEEHIQKILFMNGEKIFGIAEKISPKTKTDKVGIIVFRGDGWVKDFYKLLTDFNLINSIDGDLNDKKFGIYRFEELKKNFNL